ncbi:acyltransferase [Bacillus sp. FJAT-49711]|uniref:acyltransferase n=1 Tax=Bacillus sp. FJAT-49711 TaxID=2833585 RepID=UPI001BC9B8BB|nr:acyltransferase [Bacillus sp. FJAT-49711]MBS4218994.1 acyltransferase [Bacillus sp. FJAT-49711]
MRKFAIFIAKIIGYLFYDEKYLKGKWFEKTPNGDGWIFVLKCFLWQKIFRINGKVPFPVNQNIRISNYKKLHFHPDDLNNFQGFGVYFQNFMADIYIGRGTYIAPNVGLITANHNPKNPDLHLKGENIVIGEKCWIGMNAVILPGVKLGDNTVVAAGAVVTKSFEEGNCIVGGVPAKLIKKIDE